MAQPRLLRCIGSRRPELVLQKLNSLSSSSSRESSWYCTFLFLTCHQIDTKYQPNTDIAVAAQLLDAAVPDNVSDEPFPVVCMLPTQRPTAVSRTCYNATSLKVAVPTGGAGGGDDRCPRVGEIDLMRMLSSKNGFRAKSMVATSVCLSLFVLPVSNTCSL